MRVYKGYYRIMVWALLTALVSGGLERAKGDNVYAAVSSDGNQNSQEESEKLGYSEGRKKEKEKTARITVATDCNASKDGEMEVETIRIPIATDCNVAEGKEMKDILAAKAVNLGEDGDELGQRSIAPSADAVIHSDNKTKVYNEAFLDLKSSANDYRKILIKFDLEDISFSDIEEMVLKLYRHYSKDCSGTIVVSQIIETQWDEETVTWEAADKFEKVRLLEQEFQFKEKDTLVEVPLDVTEALENLKESGTSELSFILELGKMSNSSSSITFASKENTNSQRKAPSLEVTISDSVKVISVDDIPEITALTGTEMDELELPEEVNAVLSDGSNMLLPVKS